MNPRRWTLTVDRRMYRRCPRRVGGPLLLLLALVLVVLRVFVWRLTFPLSLLSTGARPFLSDARVARRAVSVSGGRTRNRPTIVSPDSPAGELRKSFSSQAIGFSLLDELLWRASLVSGAKMVCLPLAICVGVCRTDVQNALLSWLVSSQTTAPKKRKNLGLISMLVSGACNFSVEGSRHQLACVGVCRGYTEGSRDAAKLPEFDPQVVQ